MFVVCKNGDKVDIAPCLLTELHIKKLLRNFLFQGHTQYFSDPFFADIKRRPLSFFQSDHEGF